MGSITHLSHTEVVKKADEKTLRGKSIDIESQFVHLARLAMAGRTNDVELLSKRTMTRLSAVRPDLAEEIRKVLADNAVASELIRNRGVSIALPVDIDSRLELLKREASPVVRPSPVWSKIVGAELTAIVSERERTDELSLAGLAPSRSALLVGPPGVGKTLAARWLAEKLHRPLLTLDLSSVMSSFLGKTGSNIRVVLDFARRQPSVLLLDEFDAIAKRRDDSAEIGELKRLVTVLLQAIDEWPADGLLVAATNHPELLDPAIWRRFDRIVEFALPVEREIFSLLVNLVGNELSSEVLTSVARLFEGKSFAEVTREVLRAKRESVLSGENLSGLLAALSLPKLPSALEARITLANELRLKGLSERAIAQRTGVARQTLRKRRQQE